MATCDRRQDIEAVGWQLEVNRHIEMHVRRGHTSLRHKGLYANYVI
jgi:hypothetical protein